MDDTAERTGGAVTKPKEMQAVRRDKLERAVRRHSQEEFKQSVGTRLEMAVRRQSQKKFKQSVGAADATSVVLLKGNDFVVFFDETL